MKKTTTTVQAQPAGRRRWGRAQSPEIEDPYKARAKPAEPSYCPACDAVFHKGRWQWAPRLAGASAVTCHACHRIKDDFPAGILTLSGAFVAAHRPDLLSLARHQEELEKQEHPQNRIMSIEEGGDRLVISTTDIHLPWRIGEALRRAFRGKLDFNYDQDGYFVRVDWRREA